MHYTNNNLSNNPQKPTKKPTKNPTPRGQDFLDDSQLFFTFSRIELQMFERFTAPNKSLEHYIFILIIIPIYYINESRRTKKHSQNRRSPIMR